MYVDRKTLPSIAEAILIEPENVCHSFSSVFRKDRSKWKPLGSREI
jgi:hypothetical protein